MDTFQIDQRLNQVQNFAKQMASSEAQNAQILKQLAETEYANHDKLRQLADAEAQAEQQLRQLEQVCFQLRADIQQWGLSFQAAQGSLSKAFPEPTQFQ